MTSRANRFRAMQDLREWERALRRLVTSERNVRERGLQKQKAVLEAIANGATSFPAIAKATGLPASDVCNCVRLLRDKGKIAVPIRPRREPLRVPGTELERVWHRRAG